MSTKPDQLYADITRETYDDYLNRWQRHTLGLIDRAQQPIQPQVDRAGERARNNFNIGRGAFYRNQGRYGIDMNPTEGRTMEGMFQRQGALAEVDARNRAREDAYDRKTGLMQTTIGVGRDIQGMGMEGLGDAASASNRRRQINRQASASQTQSILSTGLGLLAAFKI